MQHSKVKLATYPTNSSLISTFFDGWNLKFYPYQHVLTVNLEALVRKNAGPNLQFHHSFTTQVHIPTTSTTPLHCSEKHMFDCIVSIRFDLDLGPTVDKVVPEGVLSTEDKQSLARIAFPDTAPDNGRSFIYFFTIPSIPTRPENAAPITNQPTPNTYGVGYFRQKKDPACPRGYVQQALLMLTSYPYFTLLDKVMSLVAPVYGRCCLQSPDSTSMANASRPFYIGAHSQPVGGRGEDGCGLDTSGMTQDELLNSIWRDVAAWAAPVARCRQDLCLLGAHFTFTPPPRAHASEHLKGLTVSKSRVTPAVWAPDVPPSLQNLPLVSSGLLTLENAGTWIKLWELSLAGEPIVVIGSDPTLSSAVVLAIESLLLPLRHPPRYNLVRPFITIQDPDTGVYGDIAGGASTRRAGGVGVLLGVTNPFFLKTLKGLGCVVSVLDEADGSGAADRVSIMLKGSSHKRHQRADISWGTTDMPTLTLGLSLTPRVHSSSEIPAGCCTSPRSKDSNDLVYKFATSVSNQSAVLVTRLRTMESVSAKQQAMAEVAPASSGGVELQSGLSSCSLVRPPSIVDDTSRKFFESLTGEFLVPIKAWFDTVVAANKPFALCCARTAQQELSPTQFMNQLATNRASKKKPPLFSHRKYAEYEPLYRRFAWGPLFESWREGAIRTHVEVEVNRLAFVASNDAPSMHPDSPSLQVDASPLLSRRYTNDEMIDTFINLHNYAAREISDCMDPDTKFILDACIVLKIIVGMCDGGTQCELFRDKIERLRTQGMER